MSKLKDYWSRWCLCYRQNGLKYTIKKTFRRIGERKARKKAEKLALKNFSNSAANALPATNPTSVPADDMLNLSDDQINVGFLLRGGLGDMVVSANYLYKFRQKYSDENLRIDVFSHNSFNSAKVVLYNGNVIDNLYKEEGFEKRFHDYDVFFDLSRYPNLKRRNDKKIAAMMPELFEYIHLSERFRSENARFFTKAGITDGQSAMLSVIKGKKRINQPDIFEFFGITEKYEYEIPIMEDELDYLKDIDLADRKFITINRGVDTNYTSNSIKMWPLSYYNILIALLKKKYPDLVLVQLGASHDRCPAFENIDIDMVGKTNLEQVKVLLKHSLVHIDNEGGMVHLRHALGGGKSVVIFGPTSADFFGYSENENLVGNGCDTWCEWAVSGWQSGCIRGFHTAPCMASVTPEMVVDAVDRIIEKENEKQ